MKRPTTARIASLLLLVALAAAAWYLKRPKPVEVRVQTVTRGVVEETVANTRAGTVNPCRRARLSPGIGGQISHLNVNKGDRVKAGALLIELWNLDLQAQIALNEAESASAAAGARAACLKAEVSRREADRLLRLRKSGAVSEEAVDKAVTEAEAQQADCDAGRSKARVSSARIQVSRAKLERTRLTAPFGGIVAEINGELNEYVTPSPPGIPTPPVIDLIDDSCFYITAPIDEVDAPRVRLQQPTRITMDAFGKRHFPGHVRRIAPYVLDREKQARTVEVEVGFDDPKSIQGLLAGYSADVEIILDARKEVLRIPTEAVVGDDRVYLLLPDQGILQQRRIDTGISNWDYTEVLSGLAAGDRVVTSVDREGVEDGAPAREEKSDAE
ncbi:MAG TPA: efflux RND transporter periplasmic adaptor subunit [Sedimenticola thiotaurini]|uniref:Efflux RND transporter periplasmic adaptor subunit n=1 Tax=Sedimenticola thiotaurini TaxID=1543721 RepID=A0A831W393_9GAMM|nr:efflux RND transporter periplasmic adaptor subunit [Sedimenticola thiotaurini]